MYFRQLFPSVFLPTQKSISDIKGWLRMEYIHWVLVKRQTFFNIPQPILFRNFLLQSRSKWLCNSLHLFPFSLSQDVFDRLTRSKGVSTSHHLFSLFQFSIFSKLNWGILFFLAALAVLYLHMGRTELLNEWVTNDYKFERWLRQCASSQITSNILTQASWRLYEIRQPPTSLQIW